MEYFTTNLIEVISKGEDIKEFFRKQIEEAVNQILKNELTVFLDYEMYDPIGYNSGNSRNGYYTRRIDTSYGSLNIEVPRDRNGEFSNLLLPAHKNMGNDLETTIIQLYKKGITTREISSLIEKMYGHNYSAQAVSNLAKLVDEDVKAFHNRQIKDRYTVIYCDATFISLRRDTVQKEALHVLIGIDLEGNKEVLDYGLYPSESKDNYKELLASLKERGLKEVLLFVSDGLTGLKEALIEEFPKSQHQACFTHIARNVMNKVRARDKEEVAYDLRQIHQAKNIEEALENYNKFIDKWGYKYPKVKESLERHDNLFSFFNFPEEIRRSIYTNNIIENFNKRIKKVTKQKEQFPNESSLDRTICTVCLEYNDKFSNRIHKGFGKVRAELEEMFEKISSL